LNLLTGQPEMAAQNLLAHADLDAPHLQPAADVNIDLVARLRRHRQFRKPEWLYGLFPYLGKRLDGVPWIEPEGFGPFHQLDHLDEFLAGFDIADVVLPALQPLRQIDLTQAGLLALSDEEVAQRVMAGRIEGTSHSAVLNGLFAYGKNAYKNARPPGRRRYVQNASIERIATAGFFDNPCGAAGAFPIKRQSCFLKIRRWRYQGSHPLD
jgi:hypothetical protein